MIKMNGLMKNRNFRIVLLFMIEYFCAYYANSIVPIIAIITILASYHIIWKYNNFAPVVMLILSARVINGFVVPSIPFFYFIMMIATYYFPAIIFLARNIIKNSGKISVTKDKRQLFGPAVAV